MTDPFATAAIRDRVLDGWSASPVRFREDANTEEDFALGGYRDRLLVELAQNAADAAARAGVPGRLRLVLRTEANPPVLVAANTGAPLTGEGVESLATLRASAKLPEEPVVGRFGVGFAAVLAVTDEPMLLSRTGGVRFSREDTAELIAEAVEATPGLGEEVRRRAGHVPVLRLPFEAEGEPPEGFDSAVVLPLRDRSAMDLVRRLLDEVDDPLLLALPALDRIEFDLDGAERILTGVDRRWRVHRAAGTWSQAEQEKLLADRPTEERARATWSVLWAVPRTAPRHQAGGLEDADDLLGESAGAWTVDRGLDWKLDRAEVPPTGSGDGVSAEPSDLTGPAGLTGTEERARPGARSKAVRERSNVLHAPTPTVEPMSLPALLIASFPLDPTRRHVAPGPLTDRMVELAADHYAELLREHALSQGSVAPYVPIGLPAGRLDGALREAILAILPRTPLLWPVATPTTGPERHPEETAEGPAEDRGERPSEPQEPQEPQEPPVQPPVELSVEPMERVDTGPEDAAAVLLRPHDAVVVGDADPELLRVLAPVVGGLVHPGPRAAYDALGVRRIPLADLVDDLAAVGSAHPPVWWRRLYGALAESAREPRRREALGGLPVPLADGRLVRGPRGLVLLQTTDSTARALGEALAVLARYGLRVVHAEAVHATLERLGAVQAGPRELLEHGPVGAAVADSAEAAESADADEDPAAVGEAVLALVASAVDAGELRPGELPWLGQLALPDEDGEFSPADALVLPGSDAEELLDPEEFARVAPDLLERWGPEVLETVGVIRTLGLVSASEVELGSPPDALADLDDLEAWARQAAGAGAMAGELTAIRDLDYVEDASWPRALRLIAAEPALRAALTDPVQVLAADGTSRSVPSYSAWWIRHHVRLDGVPPSALSDPQAEHAWGRVLKPAPTWLAELDPVARTAIGLVRRARDLDAEGVRQVLARLGEDSLLLDASTLLALWSELSELDELATPPDPPDRVRVLEGTESTVIDADDAVVADAPMWLQRTDLGGFVVADEQGATRLAELLDLPLASECAEGAVTSDGEVTEVPPVVRLLLPDTPGQWWEHNELRVDGEEVDWWVDAGGRPHAATVEGLARALSWATGRWPRRLAVEALLGEPERAGDLLSDLVFDPT